MNQAVRTENKLVTAEHILVLPVFIFPYHQLRDQPLDPAP